MILLDTHAWIWMVSSPEMLSHKARQAVTAAIDASEVHLSAISAWEVAVLHKRGRLDLTMGVRDWIARSEELPFLHVVPVNTQIAIDSVELPGPLHDDPADRIIIATARFLNATLVTKDEKILKYPKVKTLW
ncbi:MAG: type II toxin-antitoxin system VapC family toxin [Nitrospiraceae bacterium]|nr:type II toxin-antitoxin system VapC family toxin [Nitrospiraceae bacterium]